MSRTAALLAPLLLVLFVGGAGAANTPHSAVPPSPTPLRFLALGDSYTFGEGVKPRERYTSQLVEVVRREGIWLAEPEPIAENGWTTVDLAAAVAARRPQGPFALVTILIGANDQFQHRSPEEYRKTLRPLLTRAVALAGCDPSRVVALSIPDWSVTPFASGRDRARIAAEIDRFNAVYREEVDAVGARWVDVTQESRRAADDPSLLGGDGLHPSAEMHRRWAGILAPTALSALRQGREACTPLPR